MDPRLKFAPATRFPARFFQKKNTLILKHKNHSIYDLTDTGLCGAFKTIRILALKFLSKNEKRSRKRRGAKYPRKGHTVLRRTFFSGPVTGKHSLMIKVNFTKKLSYESLLFIS